VKKNFFEYLLFPFSLLFGMVVFLRKLLFDWNILPSREFDVPVVCVGNLRVGGTGKTPHIEYLVSILSPSFRCAVLSRGYKRKTRGFHLADQNSGVETIGDEPLQIARKFPGITVAVDANRCRGIEKLLELPDPPDVILLDDAFQHRYVKPGISIVLNDYNFPAHSDSLLPFGRLREPASALQRADIIIVSKSPERIKPIERRIMLTDLSPLPFQQLYFTKVVAKDLQPVFPGVAAALPNRAARPEILLLAGIANPRDVKRFARNISPRIHELFFPDHHHFSPSDISRVNYAFSQLETGNRLVITTEKDATRLRYSDSLSDQLKQNLYYIPIAIEFLNDEEENFKNHIIRYVKSNKKNRKVHPEENKV
jgi:tetraacyldisaccharide 4'-kinase